MARPGPGAGERATPVRPIHNREVPPQEVTADLASAPLGATLMEDTQ